MSDSGKYDFINDLKIPEKRVPDCSHNYKYPVYVAREKKYRTVKQILREAEDHRKYDFIDKLKQHSQTFIDIGAGAIFALIIIGIVYKVVMIIINFWFYENY